MRFTCLFDQPLAQRYFVLVACVVCLIILADSNPVAKVKAHSSASPQFHALAVLPKNSSNDTQRHQGIVDRHKNWKNKSQKEKAKKNATNYQKLVIEKPVHLAKNSSSNEHDLALLPQSPSPSKVGQLPAALVIPPTAEVNSNNDGHGRVPLPDAKVGGDHLQIRNQEQGVAVGVGAMNRAVPAANKTHQVHHQGPDNLLDVGAADRKDSRRNSKDLAQTVDQLVLVGKQNEEVPNLALQQPPPQAREPPLDRIRAKEAQLGPIEPHQGRIMSGPSNLQHNDKQKKHIAGDLSVNNDLLKLDRHVIEMAQKEPVKLAELNPPDHMEGIRMEKDGHLNRDYKKEIFFGHHDEFEWTDEEKVSVKLKSIFRRANKNNDHFLDETEIQNWIAANIRIHLQDAVKDNAKVFKHLDADRNGLVSWTEFFSHFLIAKGYVLSAKDVSTNISLEHEDNERIMKYRYRWSEADSDSTDDLLDDKELMNFRHPEQSKRMISELVKDLINNLDRDGNGVISEKEFIALPHNLDGERMLPMEETWQEERKKEFRDVIDLNNDGNADTAELMIYFDPNNLSHARLEAQNLIRMADNDNDGKLTIEEVLDNTDLFVGSKMVDAKRKLHDEF